MSPSLPLKRCADLITSVSAHRPLPYVALEHVGSGTGRLVDGLDLVERDAEEPGCASVQPGDVLFGKLRPYLEKSLLVERALLASTELLALRPRRDFVEPRFLAYVVRSRRFVEWAVAGSDGAKMPRTSWRSIREFRLDLPKVELQHRISDFLDAETARIDALIEMKRQMMSLVFEQAEACIELELRAAAERHGEAPLKRMAREVTVGIVVTPARWYAEEGVPALRGINVLAGRVRLDDLVYLTPEGHALHPKSRLLPGDLVTVRSGQAGATAVVPDEFHGANCIDLLITRPAAGVSSDYLETVVNSDWCRKHVAKHSVGAIQSHFNVEALKGLPVPMLPVHEQEATAKRLREARDKAKHLVATLAKQIDLLIEHRQTLITAAVSGVAEVA